MHDLDNQGFAFARRAISSGQRVRLLNGLLRDNHPGFAARAPHALRNLLWYRPGLAVALAELGVDGLATAALRRPAFPINALYFDKTSEANWKVPRHQDLVMPVRMKVDEPGFSGWTEKAGVVHVEPPIAVLERLLALRIHFDDCPASNGSLAVAPGSHRRGKLSDGELAALDSRSFVDCEASAGDVLAMKPLLVHRSSAAVDPGHRRVLHVVYATEEPGSMIRWRRPT